MVTHEIKIDDLISTEKLSFLGIRVTLGSVNLTTSDLDSACLNTTLSHSASE